VTIETIREAWTARQEKCKTVRVSLSWQSLVPKGTYDPVVQQVDRDDKGSYPATDVTLKGTYELVLDGERYQIRRSGEIFSAQNKVFVKSEDQYSLSKTRQVNYNVSTSSKSHGTAHLHNTDYKLSEWRTTALAPFVCAFRGAFGRPPFGDILVDYEPSQRTTMIGGRKCIELVHRKRVQDLTDSLWVDPERGLHVVRRVIMKKSQVLSQVDVTLESHAQIGWVPKSWKCVTHGADGSLCDSVTCTVTTCEIDSSISDADFEPVFAPGTHVMDHTDSAAPQYVVQPDGNEGGRIPTRELPTYEQLAAIPATSSSIWPYLIGTLAALAILVAGVWAWNRFLRRKQPPSLAGGNP
jgi:hypothetical protein